VAALLDGAGKRRAAGREAGCFRPFPEYPASTSLSRKTIRKHVDNLRVLGGEIIRDLNEDPSLRRQNVEKILRDAIDEYGPRQRSSA
jgi:hypothetical protein